MSRSAESASPNFGGSIYDFISSTPITVNVSANGSGESEHLRRFAQTMQ